MAVLVVDDQPELRALWSRGLARAGYVVVEASDGVEAWERVKAGGIHLVITDWMMPRGDGGWLVDQIVQCHPSLPVLLVTSLERKECWRSHWEAGDIGYLKKPAEMRAVLAWVARYATKIDKPPLPQ